MSELGLMLLAGVVTYTAMTCRLSLPAAAVLLLIAGIGLGTLIYHGYDIDKEW